MSDIIANPQDEMMKESLFRLCGKVGCKLILNVKQGKFTNEVEMARALLKFFCQHSGEDDLWDLIDSIVNGKELDSSNRILQANDIARVYYSKVQQLEIASPFSFLGTALAKKEDKMAECAKIYLRLGDVKQYCEIMISLELWEKAIAFAPYVSMDYWQECVKRHVDMLKTENNEDLLGYQLLANDVEGVIQSYIKRKEYENARLVKILGGSEVFFDASKNYKPATANKTHPLNATFESMSEEHKKQVIEISHLQAEQYFANGEVILGAAAELAIGDSDASIVKLIRTNELVLAYFVAKLLKVPVLDQISLLLALKSERLGQMNQAAYYYKNSINPRTLQLFIVRNKLDLKQYNIKIDVNYTKLAANSQGVDAVFYNLLAGNLKEAAKLVIETTKRTFSDKKYALLEQVLEMHSLIQNIQITDLAYEDKTYLLYYGSLIGFFKALWLGFTHAISPLLSNAKKIERQAKTSFKTDYKPLDELEKAVTDAIQAKGVNLIEDIVDALKEDDFKIMIKGILKAIIRLYKMGILT